MLFIKPKMKSITNKHQQENLMLNQNNPKQNKVQYTKMHLQEIKRLQSLSASDILVFMVLRCFVNNSTRESYPSVKTIIEYTGVSRGSVLRAFKKLKQKNIIKEEGYTQNGVKRWSFTGITSDTGIRTDTGITSDTGGVSELIQGGIASDTREVSELIHKSNKLKEKEKDNCKASKEEELADLLNDEKMFLLLWNKWSTQNICKWSSSNPLQDWRQIKAEVKEHIKSKDLITELTCIDIFLMQQLVSKSNGKEYTGAPVLWSGARFMSGICRWLSSETPSYINAKKKQFLKHAISLSRTDQDMPIAEESSASEELEENQDASSIIKTYENRLTLIYEDFQKHNDMFQMKLDFQDLFHTMNQECTDQEIQTMKSMTRFYEMFYSLGEV